MQTFSREKDEKDHLDDDNCSTCQGCRNGPTKVPDGDARTGVRDVVAAELLRQAEREEDQDDREEVKKFESHCDVTGSN